MAELKIITVKSNLPDKARVALWEKHPAHPGGEVFVTGEAEFKVAETPAVSLAIREEKLVKVGGDFAGPTGSFVPDRPSTQPSKSGK